VGGSEGRYQRYQRYQVCDYTAKRREAAIAQRIGRMVEVWASWAVAWQLEQCRYVMGWVAQVLELSNLG
jgi:hypothetical protein